MAKNAGGRGAGRLSGHSVADLHAELVRRQRGVRKLMTKRDRLAGRLEVLDREITSLGGNPGGQGRGRSGGLTMAGAPRRRPKNESNLVDALHKVLTGKTMSVTEVAEAVQQAGYQTSSSSFRTIVNQTLINSGRFKRTGRGQYTSK